MGLAPKYQTHLCPMQKHNAGGKPFRPIQKAEPVTDLNTAKPDFNHTHFALYAEQANAHGHNEYGDEWWPGNPVFLRPTERKRLVDLIDKLDAGSPMNAEEAAEGILLFDAYGESKFGDFMFGRPWNGRVTNDMDRLLTCARQIMTPSSRPH